MTATVFLVLFAGHLLGDWVAQTDWQATTKTRSWAALAAHVATYHLVIGALLLLPVVRDGWPTWKALVVLLVSAATHAVIDRRWPVRALLAVSGSPGFATIEWGVIAVDQALHLAILAMLAALLGWEQWHQLCVCHHDALLATGRARTGLRRGTGTGSERTASVALCGVRTWYDEHGEREAALLHPGMADVRAFALNSVCWGLIPRPDPGVARHCHTPEVDEPITDELTATDTIAFLERWLVAGEPGRLPRRGGRGAAGHAAPSRPGPPHGSSSPGSSTVTAGTSKPPTSIRWSPAPLTAGTLQHGTRGRTGR